MEDKKPVSSDKWTEALYETLKLNNAYDKDYDTFYNDFYAPGIKGYTYRKDVYDDMTSHGLDLGATYEEFASKIGLHAIDPQTQQTPMGADSISKDMKPVEVTPTKKPEAKKEEKPEVSAEAVSENQHPTDTLQDFNPNVSRMRNAGTDYYLQAAEEISNNAYSKSLEELANQAAKDLNKKAYQKPKEDSYVRLNQTARYIPIRSLPKDADLDSVFEAALTFENQVCGGAKEYTFAPLGGDIQERYEKWKALKGLGSSYTQETASMSPNAVYLQAINLQALGKERPAWISELRWNEALNYDKNKLNKITAELEQEDQKRRLKRSDGAYPDDVSLNGMYHANYTALMASDIYNNGTNKTIFVLFQDGRIRPLQAPDPSILRGGVEAQRELFRRQYEKMTFGEEGKEGYTDPYEKNRVVGNFLQNGEVCHIIYFPYMIEQRRWDDAQELIKIGLGGKFNEKGVLLNPDDRLQIVPVVVKNGESEEDAIAKAKVELDNEISKKLPYKETYLQQQIAQAREALKKEQERLKQFGDHDYVKESYMAGAINPRSLAIKLMANTEEGAKISDEVALARGNIRKLEESIKKYTQALEALRTGDKVGFWGGFLEGISDLDNWTFGLYNLRENLVAVKAHEMGMGQEAKDRLGLARSLSQESMSAFHRHGEGRFYGPGFGAGYSTPFTLGAIATYGAGNVAARGIIRGGSRMAAKYGTNWFFDTTIRATTRLAAINAAGVIDSSFQMPRIISDAAIEKMGLMNYTFDENQRIVVTGTQQEKSWGHSLLHSGLNTLVQNVSERVGTYVLNPVAKAFGIGKISLRSFGEALPYNKTIHMIQNGAFAKAMSKVYGTFEKGGYDGFVNEVLEEYIANPMTATFDENYTFADIFDSRQNLDTALSVWASSIFILGFSSTASSVKYYRTLRSVNSAYDKAEANARRLFGNENWDKIQNTILRLEGEPLVNAIYAGVCQNKSLSDEQKKAFLNYVRAQKAQAVFNNAVSEKYSFSLTGEELNEMNAMTIHAYAEGRNMQTPQEYAQAQQAFADTREMAMSALGVTDDIDAYLDTLGETPAEQLKKGVEVAKENGLDEKAANTALSAYLNAREQQKGAMDGITSDESIRRQHADSVIRQITFENEADDEGGSGKIILVNVKGREKPVFLVRGRYENGSITGETVVVSEGNGVIEMIPASEVEGIVEESDAMTERQRKYDKIDAENKEQQRLINLNMDTPLAGQGGILMDEEGHRRQVGIKCVFNDEQGNPASVLVVDQNNNDYLIPIDVFREQRGRGRKFEAIEPYLDETDEEYHAAEGPMNEEYNLANKEQEGVSEEDAQGAAEGVTPQPTTDATEKPTKPEVKYDYHVKMKDGSGNAVSGRVTNLSADGVEIEFDAPYNGKMVDRIPLADFDNGVSEIADANGNVLWNETEAVGDTEVVPQVDATPTQAGQEDAEKSAIAQAEQEHKPTALERIPHSENGEPLFEQAENPEVAWDALVEFSDGNAATAKEIADAMTEEKRKALEKARKLKLKGKTPAEMLASKQANAAELAKAESEYNHWQRIANVEQNRQNAIRAQKEAEARQRATERAEAEKAKREAREEAERREREALEDEVKRTVEHFPMETPEEAAAFDKRVPEMKDSELLAYMQEDGKGDINSAYHMNIYDEYDYRHTDEQTEAYNTYIQQLHDSNTTLEQAEEMLGNILGDVERFATDERSQLIGQSDALQDYITELERQKEDERAEAENSAENTDANHVGAADVAENKSAEPVEADKSKQYGEYQEVYDNFVSDVENRGMIPDLRAIKNKIRDTKRRLTVLKNGAATSIQSDEDLIRFETAEKKLTDLLHVYEAMRDYTEARIKKAEAAAQRKPWSEKNAQERMDEASKNPLTEEEIQNDPTDEVNKANALDYLSGNHGLIQSISYLKVYEDVRNPNGSAASDSGTKDKTQLAGRSNSASEGRDTGGKSGGTAGRVDNGGSRENVSEQSDGGKSGERSTRDNAGEGSNTGISTEEQPVGRRDANSGKPRRGGTSGRTRSDGGRSGRGESGNPATENGTRRAASESVKEESADDFLNQALGEFKDVLDDFIKAGRGELSISLVGLNSKQMEILPRLIQVGAKVGYAYIRKGVHGFTEWANHVKEAIGKYLRDANLSDDEIDAFIKEMWKSKIPFDGQIHTLEEWASIYSKKDLRNKVRTTIEEKREAQRQAESISVKTGDINNIRETLPFLLPQQQEDVLRAETQFFDETHQDREHANGKGYMFTNGTGTGKTYTGLGIVKRFVKQGKKRILILTPSQPKVRDWINDGKNLGLEIKSLDDWAKERGTTATTEAGEGTIITTYANFRQNEELLNGTFDLIVYDESHRLMENKNAANTIGTNQHHMIANRDAAFATIRLRKINPFYQERDKVNDEFKEKREQLVKELTQENPNETDGSLVSKGLIPHSTDAFNWHEEDTERFPEFAQLHNRFQELTKTIIKEVDPQIEEQAKKDAAHTKVVFLSATPFNTRENIDYAQGYIFSYPDKEQARGYSVASPMTIFFEEHFGAAYKWRYGRLEHSERNAEAIAQQEREFSDWLQHTLCTMSGRIIDSEYDYSRDFPVVSVEHAEEINNAAEEILRDKYFNMAYHKVFGNYNYAGALFETLKVATLIPRIKQHLKAGRKVVIFHRRVESKTPLIPPFAAMLSACHAIIDEMKMKNMPKEEIDAARHRLEELKEKWRGLLKWESMLDYSMPREQIAKAFGADNVLYFSGQESTKEKNQAVDSFNNDESGKNIIVIQEASGKEGISLHDTTGKHQRVLITLALPQSPITALQIEGRIYRIGNRSNAIFEYPLLGLNSEIILFGQKFNGQIGTTENLALGSQARNLRESFARSVEESGKDVPIEEQGFGGKEADAAERDEISPFDRAVLDYYGNQKLKGKRDSREGVDYYPTPEPLGFKMVEWGNLNDGETALEPSAGHGAIARYVPSANPLTAIEPSQNLFAKLQLKAGGSGRKFVNTIFEGYNVVNKHDVIFMNPPFGTGGRLAVDHVAKAFTHLTEGGRIVAIIPRGSTDKKFDKWIDEQENAVVTGEIMLPDITFQQAGTSVMARVLVIDKVTNQSLRSEAESKYRRIDLSRRKYDKIEDFFEDIRDIQMPSRTIDEKARMLKRAAPALRDIKELKGVVDVQAQEDGIDIRTKGSAMGFYLDLTVSDFSLQQQLRTKYQRYAQEIEWNEHRHNEKAVEIYKAYNDLVCRLLGKTAEEVESDITREKMGLEQPHEEQGVAINVAPQAEESPSSEQNESTTESSPYHYELKHHTKTGAEMFMAMPNEKSGLSSEEYSSMLAKAKKHGGYWNRFMKGFAFPSEKSAKDFLAETGNTEPQADERYQKAGTPLTPNSAEVALRDAIADLMRKSGLEVLDSKEGQQVLDEANRDELRMSLNDNREYKGKSSKERSDIQYKKAKELLSALHEAGFKGFEISRSITPFGVSTYIQGDLGLKFRISDHGVSSFGRIFGEEHISLNTSSEYVVQLAKDRKKDINAQAEKYKKERAIKEEREKRANEKWNRIKANFEGMVFKRNDRTYQDYDTFSNAMSTNRQNGHKYQRRYVMQTAIGKSGADTAYRYEWAEPADIDEYGVATNIGSDRPSLEFIEAYDEPDTAPIIREQRVYHGSGADFDHFDHSHMGEGEGAQVYGWGTYVTEVKGIGEGYAIRSMNGSSMSHDELSLKRSELEYYIASAKEKLPFLKGEYKAEVEAQISEWEEQLKDYEEHNYLYTVEIPDDNGSNYLDWDKNTGVDLVNRIRETLRKNADLKELYDGSELNAELEHLAPKIPFSETYIFLYELLGSDKAASQMLHDMGFTGIKYPADYRQGGRADGAKNYVIFNEEDAKITDRIRFFRTSNGEAYGFTVGGKIYIDPRIATAETPIHEYAHLWATAMREGNPTEWKNIVGLMKGTSVWAEVQKLYPELKNDDDIADEVLATFSGRRGAERLRAEQQKIMQGNGSVFEKAAAVGALARVKQALSKFWKGVADFLGIHYTSAEEVADRVMKDLLEGVDPRKFGVSGVLRESIRLPKTEYAKVAHAIATNKGFKKAGMNEVFTDNNYYIYTAKKNGDFTVRFGLPIEGNEDVINELSKGVENGTIRNTRSLYSVIERERSEQNENNYNYVNAEGRQKSTGAIGNLALRQQADSTGSDGYLGEEIPGRTPAGNSDRGTGREAGRVDDNLYRQGEDTPHTATSSESKSQAAQKATENLNLGGRVVVHESAEGLEGKEATAKGWYDTRTGQIHVVLSNNTDAADVTQTILHEAVAHHGLRELFGHNVMDAFLDSVLAAASQEVKDAINELRRGKGWNFRTATEEYLAGLAERTDFERMTAEERGLFATIRRLFNHALEFLGLKNHELSDRELAYILWCSYQNLKTGEKGRYVAEAERIAMRYKLKAGKNAMTDTEKKEHSVLLRGELDNLQEILAKDTYERLVTRGSHLERTAWVDMLSPLQDLQHAIEKNGGFKLGDFENPYNAYITMSSRNYAQMDIYKRTLYADMIEAIHALGSETGRSYEEIKTYVMAKHGMERQKYMAGKAAEEAYDRYKSMHPFGQKTLDDFIDEYEEKSFAGLTELFGTQSVSDAMDEAQKYVEEVEAEAGSLADSLWDSIRAATKSSLQRAYEAGLISKETYDNVSSMYQYYIPLRGFDETTSDEVYEYFGDQTINGGTGSFMKKAKGRKSVADDPFAVIGNMAEMAIMQSNRNLMKQQLLNLALNHPSDLISVSDLYVKFDEDYDNGDGTRGAWVPVAVPDTSGMTTEEANQVMLDFQDDMEEKVKDEPDTYALAHQKPHIPYRVLGRNMNEHQVMVKRGGKTYILTINGNPRAAQAINGLLNPDATENPGAIALKAMTNWIARMATARNVEFAISNAMRDLEFSTTLIPKEGTEYYGRYVKNYLTCVKNIGRLVNRLNGNTLDMSNPLEKAFYDFIYNGGETGYTFMKGVERYKGEITKALSELRAKEGKSNTERLGNKIVYGHHYIINDAWNIYMKGAEYLSRCTEDWVRFAVFLTSRQSGRSMEQSIMDAKEVTVNFNRKGAGSKSAGKWDVSNFFSMNNLHFLSAYAASAFKNFYAFSNASIQGLDKNVRLHLNHTAGMLMWDGAAVTLGMLSAMCIPLMLSAIGGDPDDYWDMPESMRRMGIMLPLGKDGRFLTLPMSIEHRAAYGIGELLGTVVCGSENLPASEITFQAFEQLSQILPLDLTEGNGSMLSLVPTAVRPEVEIAFNKNWLGMPIYKEPFNKNTPAFRNVYQSTNPNYIAMSKWLNEVQGGGDYERAGVQVNPAMVQHLVESYTGGAGKFVSRTSGVIAKIIQGEQIRSNEIPFYRTLVKSVDDRTHNRAARERFQREYDKGQKLIYKIDNYQKESARGNSQYVKELDEFAKSKDFMSYMLWKSYNSVKSQFDNARSYIGDDKDKRAALDHAQMLVQKMMTECARTVENSKTQEEADEKIGRIQSEYTPQIKETLSKVED